MAKKDLANKFFAMEEEFSLDTSIVVYGPPGVGKTTFASSLEDLLFIDVEKGRTSILKTQNRPTIFQPDNPEELGEAYLWLKANEGKFKAVAIDTYTEVEKWFLAEAVRQSVEKDPTKDPNLATQNDYGRASRRMTKMTRSFHSLPMLKVYICHEREEKDEETGSIMKGPALMPSVVRDLNAYVDYIFYMSVDRNGNRAVYTSPSSKYWAKHRIGKLPKKIELPDDPEKSRLSDVVEELRKSVKGNSAQKTKKESGK